MIKRFDRPLPLVLNDRLRARRLAAQGRKGPVAWLDSLRGWQRAGAQDLKALAKAGTPTHHVAKKLGRTAAAVQQKAMRAGISFHAAKKSGARKKK